MKTSTKVIIAVVVVVAVLLVWGLIGSSKTANIGIDCDLGIGNDGSALCWKWHKNVIGEVADNLNDLFGK